MDSHGAAPRAIGDLESPVDSISPAKSEADFLIVFSSAARRASAITGIFPRVCNRNDAALNGEERISRANAHRIA